MQYAIGVGSAVCCFGAAYAAHMIFPTKPIAEGDILLSQSTMGTLNFLPLETLKKMKLTPRKLIDLYIEKRANLADVLMIVSKTSSIDEAIKVIQAGEKTPENLFLTKAIQDHYPTVAPEPAPPVVEAPPAPPPAPAARPLHAPPPPPVAPPSLE
jgi:hypothetical protein